MGEKKYEVFEGSSCLASNMSLDMALVFVKGYANEYYNMKLNLIIHEMEPPQQKVCKSD